MIDLRDYLEKAKYENSSLFDEGFDVDVYAKKLNQNSDVIVSYSCSNVDGFIAYYANDSELELGFISFIYVNSSSRGLGVGEFLIKSCLMRLKSRGFKRCMLEVKKNNTSAIRLYNKIGFLPMKYNLSTIIMELDCISY